jgi:hypothetical protein
MHRSLWNDINEADGLASVLMPFCTPCPITHGGLIIGHVLSELVAIFGIGLPEFYEDRTPPFYPGVCRVVGELLTWVPAG